MRWVLIVVMVLAVVPSFSGTDRLPVLGAEVRVSAARYVPEGGWPARVGALEPVGGVVLFANDPAFGSFSALAIHRNIATLLGDGGNWVRLSIARGQVRTLAAGALRDGPGTGWAKGSRDTESLVIDPAGNRAWIGYERANAVWRYDAGLVHAAAWRRPAMMRRWPDNGGAEAMAARHGRFVVIAEYARAKRQRWLRQGLIFAGDPALATTPVARFTFATPRGYDPSDAAFLPDGDLLVLVRRWQRFHFSARLIRVAAAAIRPGATVRGRVIAEFAPPLLGENPEGLAVTREKGRTMVWIVTDNDGWWLRRTLMLKFRLR